MLAIPVVVGFGTVWFTGLQQERDEYLAEQRSRSERDIAADNQREAALQAYINAMSEILLDKGLSSSKDEDKVRGVARIRTLTILRRLDSKRKGSVLQFLHEAGLIKNDKPIVLLFGAGLAFANLVFANLSGANLNKVLLLDAKLLHANLNGADLTVANLSGANLSRTDLTAATLRGAKVTLEQLNQAKSLKGATMPDGSIHP